MRLADLDSGGVGRGLGLGVPVDDGEFSGCVWAVVSVGCSDSAWVEEVLALLGLGGAGCMMARLLFG